MNGKPYNHNCTEYSIAMTEYELLILTVLAINICIICMTSLYQSRLYGLYGFIYSENQEQTSKTDCQKTTSRSPEESRNHTW